MKPYLSFVVTSRNDNHGGQLLKRMQLFVDSLVEQCNRFQLDTELILIEWNPPPQKPKLCKALKWPPKNSYCKIRIIEVPHKIHRKFKYSDKLPLFQMIAKNVGIRRAKGEYILCTNIDILFSNELIKFLASKKLNSKYFYRVNRYDVNIDINKKFNLDQRLFQCSQNVIRIHFKKRSFITSSQNSSQDSFFTLLIKAVKFVRKMGKNNQFFLHTNGCGDFTLMSKDNWIKIYGYPEFEMFSLMIDSLGCYLAYYNGIKEHILNEPYKIYHLEHLAGSGWTPEHEDLLKKRLKKLGVPLLSYEDFKALVEKIRRHPQPPLFNKSGWGLKNYKLYES